MIEDTKLTAMKLTPGQVEVVKREGAALAQVHFLPDGSGEAFLRLIPCDPRTARAAVLVAVQGEEKARRAADTVRRRGRINWK